MERGERREREMERLIDYLDRWLAAICLPPFSPLPTSAWRGGPRARGSYRAAALCAYRAPPSAAGRSRARYAAASKGCGTPRDGVAGSTPASGDPPRACACRGARSSGASRPARSARGATAMRGPVCARVSGGCGDGVRREWAKAEGTRARRQHRSEDAVADGTHRAGRGQGHREKEDRA